MSRLTTFIRLCVLTAVILAPRFAFGEDRENKTKPLFRDFMGLNVHTVQFKTELYKPVTRLLRDYHGFKWDVGDETDFPTRFPFAATESIGGRCTEAGTRRGTRST